MNISLIILAFLFVCQVTRSQWLNAEIPQNFTNFDLSEIEYDCSLGFMILEIISPKNDLPKNITNTKRVKDKCIRTVLLKNKEINFIDKLSFLNFIALNDLNLARNSLKSIEIVSNTLEILRLEENEISEITAESFKNSKNLKTIYLNFNKIQSINEQMFSELKQIEVLYLYKNSIGNMSIDSFATMKSLKVLSLSSNKLTIIKNKTFRNLNNLKELMLYENEIVEIDSDCFLDLINLEKLHLYSNKISNLSVKTFTGLKSLQELWLQKNDLKSIQPIFNDLTNLVSLCLDRNKIEIIDTSSFDLLIRLNKVELFSNNIKSFESLLFTSLRNFTYLNLSSNFLTKTFKLNCSYIVDLNLNLNQLTDIRNDFNLPNLEVLLASANKIQRLYNQTFVSLKRLNDIDLSLNRIITIEKNSFKGLSSLKSLNLSNNYLDDSNSDYFIEDLIELTTLDLSFNKMVYFKNGYFSNLKKLKKLWINNNFIKKIEPSLFHSNQEIVYICLNYNKLKYVSLNLTKLENLDLNSNLLVEFREDNSSLPSLSAISLANNKIEKIIFNNNSYLNSIDMSNNNLGKFNESLFLSLKNLTTLKMNNSGSFYFNFNILSFNKVIELDLSFNNILSKNFSLKSLRKLERIRIRGVKFANEIDFDFLLNPDLKEVDFSQNSIKNFSIFDKLVKIKVLELSQVGLEEITRINLNNFQNLKKLDLSINKLLFLNESSFRNLSNLVYLDLSNNFIKHLDVDIFHWLYALVYLNLERNNICLLGDVFMNYLNILQIKLANNCLSRLPNFEIKTDTDRPAFLVDVDVEFNHFKNIQKFSNAVSQIKVLKFDSNNISVIDDDAFFNLNELKYLYLSNNSLFRLSQKDFLNLFSLEYLNLSLNKISEIEQNTFQNLKKLLTLDLSQNLLLSLEARVFYGLVNLKNLYLKYFIFKINNKSFEYLYNVSNIYLNESIVEENQCLLKNSFRREIVKKSFLHENSFVALNRSVFRFYYHSLNFLTGSSNEKNNCDLMLFFLQFNFHLNLKTDSQVENFYSKCENFLIKKQNDYDANKLRCRQSQTSSSHTIELFEIRKLKYLLAYIWINQYNVIS